MNTDPQQPTYVQDKIRIWEKVIDVQMHFNEIKSKNQTLFISIITAFLAGAGFLYKHGNGADGALQIICTDITVYIYSLPFLGASIFTIAFYVLDFSIYHTLLKGSIECGKEIEEDLGIDLTSRIIEKESQKDKFLNSEWFRGAGRKLSLYYFIIIFSLLGAFFVINFLVKH